MKSETETSADARPASRRRRIRRTAGAITATAVAALLLAGCSTSSGAASSTGGTDSLVVGVRNVQVPQAALYWAAAKGYFSDAGVNVSVQAGEAAQPAQLVAGQSDIYFGAQGALFGITNSGKTINTIYGLDSEVAAYVVTSNDAVKSPADCKTVTTATPGTVIYAWTKQLEKVYNVTWDLTQLTTVPAILANVEAGRTDCAVGAISYYQSGVDSGSLRVVLDPTDKANLPSGWPTLGVEDVIAGLPDTLQQKKPAVEKFLAAYNKAVTDFKAADPKDIAQTLIASDPAWAAVGSADVLAEAIKSYAPILSPNGGYISSDTWDATLAFFGNGGLDFLATDPSRFDYSNAVDMAYYNDAIGQK